MPPLLGGKALCILSRNSRLVVQRQIFRLKVVYNLLHNDMIGLIKGGDSFFFAAVVDGDMKTVKLSDYKVSS